MDYMKLKPDEMVEYVKPIIDEVKNVNGDLIAIWHNYALSNIDDFEGYKAKFEEIIKISILR